MRVTSRRGGSLSCTSKAIVPSLPRSRHCRCGVRRGDLDLLHIRSPRRKRLDVGERGEHALGRRRQDGIARGDVGDGQGVAERDDGQQEGGEAAEREDGDPEHTRGSIEAAAVLRSGDGGSGGTVNESEPGPSSVRYSPPSR